MKRLCGLMVSCLLCSSSVVTVYTIVLHVYICGNAKATWVAARLEFVRS